MGLMYVRKEENPFLWGSFVLNTLVLKNQTTDYRPSGCAQWEIWQVGSYGFVCVLCERGYLGLTFQKARRPNSPVGHMDTPASRLCLHCP